MGLAALEIDGERITLDQTDTARIAERMRGTELAGRLTAAIIASGETVVVLDADPVERRRLYEAVVAVAAGTANLTLVHVLDALRAGRLE